MPEAQIDDRTLSTEDIRFDEAAYITLPQAARLCGVTYQTGHRWVREGRFGDVHRTASGRIYVAVSEVEALLMASRREVRHG